MSDFDKFYKEMVAKIKESTDSILESARKEKLAIKQSGFLAENIWLLDFKDANSFAKAERLFTMYTVPKNVIKVTPYTKTKRIAFTF